MEILNKKIALTFDDGPQEEITPRILEILKKHHIKAHFFVCGSNAERFPELIQRIHSEGHILGNHTYHHKRLQTVLGINFSEIMATQKLIERVTKENSRYFRPPWGHMPFWLNKRLKKEGFTIVPYSISGNDWKKNITASKITKKIIDRAKDRDILLLHDGAETKSGAQRTATVEALSGIIEGLKKRNFEFVTIEKL